MFEFRIYATHRSAALEQSANKDTLSALIVHIHWLTWSRCRGPAFLENRYAVGQPQRTQNYKRPESMAIQGLEN